MNRILVISALDSIVGRFNQDMMPQQDSMELFVQQTDLLTEFFSNAFWDIQFWPGIHQGSDGEILAIEWVDEPAGNGTLDFQWIPSTCTEIYIERCGFDAENIALLHAEVSTFIFIDHSYSSSIELKHFPKKLRKLRFQASASGALSLEDMSHHLLDFNFADNRLQGALALECLREPIETFIVSNNRFQGTLNMAQLPASLRVISLNKNTFDGAVSFSNLPLSLQEINLSENRLCGSIRFENMPPKLQSIFLWNNGFAGDAFFENLPDALQSVLLFGTKVSRVIGNDGEVISDYRFVVEFHGINFQTRSSGWLV